MATLLYDPGFTFSYVSIDFVVGLDMVCDILDAPIDVSNY